MFKMCLPKPDVSESRCRKSEPRQLSQLRFQITLESTIMNHGIEPGVMGVAGSTLHIQWRFDLS